MQFSKHDKHFVTTSVNILHLSDSSECIINAIASIVDTCNYETKLEKNAKKNRKTKNHCARINKKKQKTKWFENSMKKKKKKEQTKKTKHKKKIIFAKLEVNHFVNNLHK